VTTKRHIIVYDAHEKNDPEFCKELVDSLGAFANSNQWSVGNLTNKLKEKSLLVERLHNEMKRTKQVIRRRMNYDIEKIRLAYQQQMKQLQEKIEMSLQNLQISNSMFTQ
jgi:hypothetical protein